MRTSLSFFVPASMDTMLHQLIEEVCKQPDASPKRRKAINRLLIEIQRLPKLGKSSHPDYLDALNRTWEWLNRSICEKFDLSKPSVEERLLQWINKYLSWRIKDRYTPDKDAPISLNTTISGDGTEITYLEKLSETGFNLPTRTGIDSYIEKIEQEQQQYIGLELERYIEQDPQGKLRNCHPQGYPDCNCQLLSSRVLLKSPPDKFAAIARELRVNYQTLKSHWERRCLPLLQEIAINLGYQPSQER